MNNGYKLGQSSPNELALGDELGLNPTSKKYDSTVVGKKYLVVLTNPQKQKWNSTFIFLKRLGIFSSSKGRVPQRSAYKITPQLQTSTSGPAYNFPEITCAKYNSLTRSMNQEENVVMKM